MLRHATEADVEPLTGLLSEPAVARWWGDYDADATRADLSEHEAIVIELDGETVGLVLLSEEQAPE